MKPACATLVFLDAREYAGDEHRDGITVTKERMHREVFEQLPEFCGF